VVGVAAKAHEGFVALVREWLDFVGRRFNDDVGLARRLTECRTHEEVVSAYTEFLRKATDDYSKQITAMTKLTTAAMGNVIDAGKLATDEAFTVSKAA
jgi:hypothetical protein